MAHEHTKLLAAALLALAGPAMGCGDDTTGGMSDTDSDSGFTSGTNASSGPSGSSMSAGPGSGPDSDSNTGSDPGTDDGEPGEPGEGEELCDAGDEAWVKRAVPYLQGRRPDGMREVRLLVSMIQQLDMLGDNGREVVARGLTRGDLYLERWKTYLFEELKVNRGGDRRNDQCYDTQTAEGDAPNLAAFIRDNSSDSTYSGAAFTMPDVVYSGLRLDDLSPVYRAQMFATMSAPLIAGNVNTVELEEMRRTNFGMTFEQVFLGRTTECNMCHRTEDAVTFDPIDFNNRHWPVPGNFELAVYGPNAALAEAKRSHAVFRFFNFATGQEELIPNGLPLGYTSAWGFDAVCGGFRLTAPGLPPVDMRGSEYEPFMISDFSTEFPPSGIGGNLYTMDELFRGGFDSLRSNGLTIEPDGSVQDRAVAAAYLTSMNIANRAWIEAMGFPLVVANNFPRNPDQRDLLQTFADAFVGESFSLRALTSAIATHEYFNQAPPATCTAGTPYHLPAIFEPFSKSASDPALQGNGVGDGIHRMGAWPMLDSIAQSMWWSKPDRFGPDTGQVPEFNCGGNMPEVPCIEEPEDAAVLRDLGAFLSDSEAGFEGTDLVALLRIEDEFGRGVDSGLHGDCTGPLGSACATDDWISQLIDEAVATSGTDMWDVAAAVKDRVIAEPMISEAEAGVLEDLMGVSLSDTVSTVGAGAAEQGARRLAGMLFNTPQFMLVGAAGPDQDPTEDPTLVVPGTSSDDICAYLAPLILDNAVDGYQFGYTCTGDGIDITG